MSTETARKKPAILGTTLQQEARYAIASAYGNLTQEQTHPCKNGAELLRFWFGDVSLARNTHYLHLAVQRFALDFAHINGRDAGEELQHAVDIMREVVDSSSPDCTLTGAAFKVADKLSDPDAAGRFIPAFALAYATTKGEGEAGPLVWRHIAQLWSVLAVQDTVAMARALRNGMDVGAVPLIRPMELPMLPTTMVALCKHLPSLPYADSDERLHA